MKDCEETKMKGIVAEVGINYAFGSNPDLFIKNALDLIDLAAVAGCTHVKFQKRNPNMAVPENKKNSLKKVPWRINETTYLKYKQDIEFSALQMQKLFRYSLDKNIIPFASVWDSLSLQEMKFLTDIVKIPSAKLTDWELLKSARKEYPFRILSTGMSTEEEIEKAVDILNPQVIMHTNSTYPTPVEDLNMGYILHLKEKFPEREIGFSNHAYGIEPIIASRFLGVSWVEFHITLKHELWGSDQAASVEPVGIFKIIKGLRDLELAISKGNEPRILYPGEESKRESLRG